MSRPATKKTGGATEVALVPTHCDRCERTARVDYVTLEQNIGLILFRVPKRLRAYLCRECTAHVFWRFTLITLVLGWWGVISFFVTFAVLRRNVATYLRTRALPPAR